MARCFHHTYLPFNFRLFREEPDTEIRETTRESRRGITVGPTKGVDASRVCTYVDGTPRAHVFATFIELPRRERIRVESRLFPPAEGKTRTACHARIPQMPKVDAIAGKRRGSRAALAAGVL